MATNSSQPGYLLPTSAPAQDDALADIMHDWFAGVTGIANEYVRPRWQPEPPIQPGFDVNWLAFGLMNTEDDAFAYEAHDAQADGGDGTSSVTYHSELEYLVSFYGPEAGRNARRMKAAANLSQNRWPLVQQGIDLIEVSKITNVPALVKEIWVPRYDVRVFFRRNNTEVFAIRNVLSAHVTVHTEPYTTTVNVTE